MADPAGGHRARALLKQFGVGKSTFADRQLTAAAYGDEALMVDASNGRTQHAVWAHKGIGGLDQLAAELIKRERGAKYQPSAEEIAAGVEQLRAAGGSVYGDDAALLAQAQRQQALVSQAFHHRQEAVEQALDLAQQNPDFRQKLLPYMGIDPAVLNARPAAATAAGDPAWVAEAARQQAYGAGRSAANHDHAAVMDAVRQQAYGAGRTAADLEHTAAMAAAQEQHAAAMAEAQRMIDAAKVTPQPPPPATGNAAASTPPPGGNAPAADAAAKTNANPQEIRPEVDNWWTASSPLLKDVPVLKNIPNWGYVGAGAAGASALAYHLMTVGQQQQNNAAYAAQVQAMNAY